MKSWLKGGLWGLGVYIILIVLGLIISGLIFYGVIPMPKGEGSGLNPLVILYAFFVQAPLFLVVFMFNLIKGGIIFFIIGTLIGLIIGKIKSKNKKI